MPLDRETLVAAVATVGGEWCLFLTLLSLPFCTFQLEIGYSVALCKLDTFLAFGLQHLSVCSLILPFGVLNFYPVQVSFDHICVSQLWTTSFALALLKQTKHDILWDSATLHASHMANPA